MSRFYAALRGAAIALLLAVSGPVTAQPAATGAGLCVLVPHFKDEYWISVGFGLEAEARRRHLSLSLHEAGGYRALDRQIAQLDACAADDSAAVLIGAVSRDDPALLAAVARAARVKPVWGLVNALDSPDLAGRVGVDWRQMGAAVGDYLRARHPSGGPQVTAVLVSGPVQAGWTPLVEGGLRAALRNSAVRLAWVFSADTGLRQQMVQVEAALSLDPAPDYIIGSAPAIEAAMGLLRGRAGPQPVLIATYVSHSMRRGLQNGQVAALPFDDPVRQGEMAVARASGAVGADDPPLAVRLVGQGDAASLRLSPAGYMPPIR